jgi:hypothetical protein
MESFLDDYIKLYAKNMPEKIINHIKECYENLETSEDRNLFNSVILVKRYKGGVYREDISVVYRLSTSPIGIDDIGYLYKNNYLTYDEFVKKYDNCTEERTLFNFALYLIDHLQPESFDIKIALKN